MILIWLIIKLINKCDLYTTKRQRREVFAAYEVKWGIHYIITYILRNIGAPCMYVCMYVCMYAAHRSGQ